MLSLIFSTLTGISFLEPAKVTTGLPENAKNQIKSNTNSIVTVESINKPGPACDPSIVNSDCWPQVAVVSPLPERFTRTPAAPLSTKVGYGDPGIGNPPNFK